VVCGLSNEVLEVKYLHGPRIIGHRVEISSGVSEKCTVV
jgi:hypothetical protein